MVLNVKTDFEELVISGISLKLPNSDNIEEFAENLLQGHDMVTGDFKNSRYNSKAYGIPERCGKIRNLENFDAEFFGCHTKQAHDMDPQLRILHELTFEALFDAGVNPSQFRGSNCGVFIGVSGSETETILMNQNDNRPTGYLATGCHRAMFANRISYSFDLKGPSMALDTACSSALLALDEAVSAIRMGRCDSAVVGGSNLILSPIGSMQVNKLNMLSNDGKCKSFDNDGDGYVRSDGIVVIFLQKKSSAKRSYGSVLHSKSNTDGYKRLGVTFPSGKMQKVLLQNVYQEAGIDPNLVTYVECHGPGTMAGDPQEVNSISEVFCDDMKKRAHGPLAIGSVKSNMGHSEATAGLAGLSKVIVACNKGFIPANLHYKSPNEYIPALTDGRIEVLTQNRPFKGGLIGINSFGFGGSNVHTIFESYPEISRNPEKMSKFEIPRILPFSGRSTDGVEKGLKKIISMDQLDKISGLLYGILKDDIVGHNYRGFTLFDGKTEPKLDISEKKYLVQDPEVWFIYPGMGTQWKGMGQDLMKCEIFKNSIKNSAKFLKNQVGFDLMEVLFDENDTFNNVTNSFVSIIAIQIGMTELLKSLGLKPDGIIGHSVGEIACAFADNCLTFEETLLSAYYRGQCLINAQLPCGAMAAVGLTWTESVEICKKFEGLYPACHNSENSVTISGPPEELTKLVEKLENDGIFAKIINTSGFAFHSPHISSASQSLKVKLDQVIKNPKYRSKIWKSSSIPKDRWDKCDENLTKCSGQYIVNNMVSPVLFKEAIEEIPEGSIVIEIAPDAIFHQILEKCLPKSCTTFGLNSRKSDDNLGHFLTNLGQMYNCGLNMNFSSIYGDEISRCGPSVPMLSSLVDWDHSSKWQVVNFEDGEKFKIAIYEINLAHDEDTYLKGHSIDGRYILPATAQISMVWRTFAKIEKTTFDQLPITFENVSYLAPGILRDDVSTRIFVYISPSSGEFEVLCEREKICTGLVRKLKNFPAQEIPNPLRNYNGDFVYSEEEFFEKFRENREKSAGNLILERNEIYRETKIRGFEYSGDFQGISRTDSKVTWGEIEWKSNWVSFLDTILHYRILSLPKREIFLPSRINKFTINPQILLKFVENNEGIEIKGLSGVISKKRSNPSKAQPKLEKVKFTPFFDLEKPKISDKNSNETYCTALSNIFRIFYENSSKPFENIGEIVQKLEDSQMEKIFSIYENIPEYKCDFTIFVKNVSQESKELEEKLTKLGIKVINCDYFGEKTNQNFHLLITYEYEAGDLNLDKMSQSLNDENKRFVLIGEKEDQNQNVKNLQIFESKNLIKISESISSQFHWKLYRKKPLEIEPKIYKSVEMIDGDLSWVSKLQNLIKEQNTNPQMTIYILAICQPNSGILGFYNNLKKETLKGPVKCIHSTVYQLSVDFTKPCEKLEEILKNDMVITVLDENGTCGSYIPQIISPNCTKMSEFGLFNCRIKGNLSTVEWVEGSLDKLRNGSSDEDTVQVFYSGMNFADVAFANGMISSEVFTFEDRYEDAYGGMEFAGIKLGPCPKRVMGCVQNGFSTRVKPKKFTWEVPSHWSLAEASTIPMAYGTAYYALIMRGRMKAGDSILIHAGTGGVGLASIILALSINCTVFTTVSTEKKKNFLLQKFSQLKSENIAYSRDTSFEKQILTQTEGQGVDLVLNSLPADRFFASLKCLKRSGKFLEIGKYDFIQNTQLGMEIFMKNIEFHGILFDSFYAEGNPFEQKNLIDLIQNGLDSGIIQPLPYEEFDYKNIENGLRFLGSTGHIGKVVIKLPQKNEEILNKNCIQIHPNQEILNPTSNKIESKVSNQNFKNINEQIMSQKPQILDKNFKNLDKNHENLKENDLKLTKMDQNLLKNDHKMTKMDQNLSKNEQKLTKMDQNLLKNDHKMTKMDQNLSKNEQKLTKMDQNLSKNEQNLTKMDQNLSKNDQNLTKMNQNLSKNDQNLTKMDQNLSKNDQNLTKMDQNLEKNDQNLSKIDQNLEKNDDSSDLLMEVTPRIIFNPQNVYIIIGGLGSMGLEFCDWMIWQGARKICLTSRSGISKGYQDYCMSRWTLIGSNVKISQKNVTNRETALELLTDIKEKFQLKNFEQIDGIFNLSMVLKDDFFINLTPQDFDLVSSSKYKSTKFLDLISREFCPNLRYFVCFSSFSCGHGNAVGQSIYGFANSAMERICENRKKAGYPANAIQWGPILDTDIVTHKTNKKIEALYLITGQSFDSCFESIHVLLNDPCTVTASSIMLSKIPGKSENSQNSKLSLVDNISQILGIKDIRKNLTSTLSELGMDSLMIVEAKTVLERDYKVFLNVQEIRNLTINEIIEFQENKKNGSPENPSQEQEVSLENVEETVQNDFLPCKCIIPLNDCENCENLFIIHPLEGMAGIFKNLAGNLKKYKVYGVQLTREANTKSIQDLAGFYLKEIRKIQPDGALRIGGYSLGGLIGLEIGLILQKEGKIEDLKEIFMIDGSPAQALQQIEGYVKGHKNSKEKKNLIETDGKVEALMMTFFLFQYLSFDFAKVKKELENSPNFDTRIEILSKILQTKMPQLDLKFLNEGCKIHLGKFLALVNYTWSGEKLQSPIILIKSFNHPLNKLHGNDHGLSKYSDGDIKVFEVSGNHRTILQSPHSAKVAQIIDNLI